MWMATAFLAAVAPTQAAAYDVHTQVANEYGYLNSDVYDVGEALVFVFLEGGADRGKFCSPAKLTRNGATLRITLTVVPRPLAREDVASRNEG